MKNIIQFFIASVLIIAIYFCNNGENITDKPEHQPKNIIIMIGDGMGFEHINTTKFFHGENKPDIYDSFPVKLAATTFPAISEDGYSSGYNANEAWTNFNYVLKDYTESAEAATAIATGIKSIRNRTGTDIYGNPLLNAVQIAKQNNKSAGIITSVQFSHATPAAFVAHNINRGNYAEIAKETLLYSKLDVLMGAGHPYYDNNGIINNNHQYEYVGGKDLWHNISEQKNEFITNNNFYSLQDIDNDGIADSWHFSDNRNDLLSIISGELSPKRFLFVSPVALTLAQERDGASLYPFDIPVNENIPALKEKSIAALELLSKNDNGFFLMIEGGAIDWAGHNNDVVRLIEEQTYFNDAISGVIDWLTKKNIWDNTLLIVVADHECGYLTGGWDKETEGFKSVKDKGNGNIPDVIFYSTNHTNHLVPFFAKGIASDKFPSYASNIDSVRGYYLDISDIGKFIKQVWNGQTQIYPEINKACPEQQVKLYVSAKHPPVQFTWYKNNTAINNESNSSITITAELNKTDKYYCIVDYDFKKEKSNSVTVEGIDCNN